MADGRRHENRKIVWPILTKFGMVTHTDPLNLTELNEMLFVEQTRVRQRTAY